MLACLVGTTVLAESADKTDNVHSNVYTQSPAYSFGAGFTALFLKPGASNLHFAAQATPLPAVSPNWNIFDVHPKYHFGFDLGVCAVFHERNTKLMINWERFKSCSSSCVKVPLTTDMVGPFFEIGPDAKTYRNATGNVQFIFDQLNVDYGQLVDFGDYVKANLFGGVGFTQVKQNLFSTYSSSDANYERTICTPISFIGAGPQVGADFCYELFCDVSLEGQALGSLFVGRAKNHTSYVATFTSDFGTGAKSPNNQSTTVCNRSLLVPAFQQSLGVAYEHTFCDDYFVKIAVGYQAQVYLNALQSTDIGSEVVTPPVIPDVVGVFARTFQRTVSNFSLAGAYITLDLGF